MKKNVKIVADSKKVFAEKILPKEKILSEEEKAKILESVKFSLKDAERFLEWPKNLPFPDFDENSQKKNFKIYEMVISEIRKLFEAEKIIIPDYQREYVWDEEREKGLEFSLIYGYPVPPIILNLRKDKKKAVLDGQQRLKAILNRLKNYEKAIADLETLLKFAEEAEKKNQISETLSVLKNSCMDLENAKVSVLEYFEMDYTQEKYSYSALNNGKTHTGSEWGRTFIPEAGMTFVKKVMEKTHPIFGKKSADFSLYLWAAMGGSLEKTPSGKKAFPVVRNLADQNKDFVFPEIPENFDEFLSAISARPVTKEEDYNKFDFAKPGFIVPMIQGLKLYGNWDFSLLAYVVKNIDTLASNRVSVAGKKSKGKNCPTTVTRMFSNLLMESGSGEALTYRKAQGWAKVLKIAKAMKEEGQEETVQEDETTKSLKEAIAEMEESND